MKKYIAVLSAFLFLTGCFIDSDTSTVRINFNNNTAVKIENESLIDKFLKLFAKEAIAQQAPTVPEEVSFINVKITGSGMGTLDKNFSRGSGTVEISVPSGLERRIEIRAFQEQVGGGDYTDIYTYGYGITTDLAAGETRNITAQMTGIPYALYAYTGNGLDVGWQIEGSLSYQFTVEWSETINGEYVELVSGVTNYYWTDIGSGISSGYVRVKAFSGENTGLYSETVEITAI